MGGWIKLEKDLYTDPRLRRAARILCERDLASGQPKRPFTRYLSELLGAVSILWITADTHVDEEDVLELGPSDIDELTGIEGFCELLPAEWLVVLDPKRVKLPKFHMHNGTDAKEAALNQRRQERYRNALALRQRHAVVTVEHDKSVTRPRPRPRNQ